MDSELLAELETRGLWVEWKTMHELLNQSPPHVWEILDRGRNLYYLAESERVYSDRFLAMAANRAP